MNKTERAFACLKRNGEITGEEIARITGINGRYITNVLQRFKRSGRATNRKESGRVFWKAV